MGSNPALIIDRESISVHTALNGYSSWEVWQRKAMTRPRLSFTVALTMMGFNSAPVAERLRDNFTVYVIHWR